MFSFSQIPFVFYATLSASHCATVCGQTTLRPAGPATGRQVDAGKRAAYLRRGLIFHQVYNT